MQIHLDSNRILLAYISHRDPPPAGTVTTMNAKDAPDIPLGSIRPQLSVDNTTWIETVADPSTLVFYNSQDIVACFPNKPMVAAIDAKVLTNQNVRMAWLEMTTSHRVAADGPILKGWIDLFIAQSISTAAFNALYTGP